jgi:hypothetical protein
MSTRDSDEASLGATVTGALKRWLGKARDAVLAPWRQYKISPSPVAIFTTQQDWNSEVGTILTEIGKIGAGAWSRASDVPFVSRHSFVVAQLAQTENLLVRIPDEVYNRIFAVITDVVNNGGGIQEVADGVDDVLSWTGSENWPSRAKTIATTEVTRAYGGATVAAGMEQSRVTGKLVFKEWLTEADRHVRATHRAANHLRVPLASVFPVGEAYLLYPGDASGPPNEVINCRCDLQIVEG